MIIFVDVLFLKDFGMTFLILLMMGEMLKLKISIMRLLVSCVVTSLISVLLIIYEMHQIFCLRIVLATITVFLAFGAYSFQALFTNISALWGISFLLGGAIFSSQTIYEFLLVSAIVLTSFYFAIYKYKRNKWITRNLYEIDFTIMEHFVHLYAFLDTGNFLTSGIKQDPVIIVSQDSIEKYLPRQILATLVNGKIGEDNTLSIKNLRKVEYGVFNEDPKEIYGIKIDNVSIRQKSEITLTSAVMIVSKQKYDKFDALIGLGALEGGICNGDSIFINAKGKEIYC